MIAIFNSFSSKRMVRGLAEVFELLEVPSPQTQVVLYGFIHLDDGVLQRIGERFHYLSWRRRSSIELALRF